MEWQFRVATFLKYYDQVTVRVTDIQSKKLQAVSEECITAKQLTKRQLHNQFEHLANSMEQSHS